MKRKQWKILFKCMDLIAMVGFIIAGFFPEVFMYDPLWYIPFFSFVIVGCIGVVGGCVISYREYKEREDQEY